MNRIFVQNKLALAMAFALVLAACSSAGAPEGGVGDIVECSTGADCESGLCVGGVCQAGEEDAGVIPEDTGGIIDSGDDDAETPDSGTDIEDTEEDAGPEPGTLGAPCERNAECDSGFCIRTSEGQLCSELCSEICPNDWECRLLANQEGDAVQLCVPPQNILCAECESDIDCDGLENLCIPLDDGTFCGLPCGDGCPDGFLCQQYSRGDDIIENCVPELGICGACYDLDGDGHGIGPECLGGDCDEISGAAASVYDGAPELCDGRDNNCNEEIDEGFDLTSDASNCGECGAVCAASRGSAICVDSACVVELCEDGWYDANGLYADGCEYECTPNEATDGIELCNDIDDDCDGAIDEDYDFSTDNNHCGECNNVCSLGGADTECRDGACRISTCVEPFEDCDLVTENGCEVDLSSSLLHCGACDNVCDLPNVAVHECGDLGDGTTGCLVVECDEGFDDCDGDPSNGCEANLDTSLASCGTCGNACEYANGTGLCVDGACRLDSCDDDWGDCDGDPSTGCETPTDFNNDHCGACGAVCAYSNSNATCLSGTCTFFACLPGYADCDASLDNGCEIDIFNSLAGCGGCGRVCDRANATEFCDGGICALDSCESGFGNCNGSELDGCEEALANNDLHCGACGNECSFTNADGRCVGTTCELLTCNSGWGNCDMNEGNGCETPTAISLDNCGGCGLTCDPSNAFGRCNSGTCEISTCFSGFDDCDGRIDNGCEADVDFGLANCGECGEPCFFENAVAECNFGSCSFVECNEGYVDLNGDLSDGCEFGCVPLPGIDLPDDTFRDGNCDGYDGELSRSIFVSPSGNDTNAGTTPDSPVRTISRGIERAGSFGRDQILVAVGTYNVSSAIQVNGGGYGIYGGYTSDFTGRSNARVTVNSSARHALQVDALVGNVTIDRIDFTTSNRTGTGDWTAVVTVSDSGTRLTMTNVELIAGRGGNGANGSPGGAGANGSAGRAASGSTGGGSIGSGTRLGGAGGNGRRQASGLSGSNGGTTGSTCGRGGAGNGSNLGCGDGDPRAGSPGNTGCSGSNGSNGSGGNGTGNLGGVGWSTSSGTGGTAGSDGGGGGGGGAGGGEDCTVFGGCIYCGTGRGGGGGGQGGGRGFGGGGGTGGGASIGMIVENSTVFTTNLDISTGGGGNGGNGGSGGSGGVGGSPGAGATNTSNTEGDGGDGGGGGRGGNGGCGGGGGGGPSIGIWGNGSAVVDATDTISYTLGSSGTGGSACTGSASGTNGVRSNTRSVTIR